MREIVGTSAMAAIIVVESSAVHGQGHPPAFVDAVATLGVSSVSLLHSWSGKNRDADRLLRHEAL